MNVTEAEIKGKESDLRGIADEAAALRSARFAMVPDEKHGQYKLKGREFVSDKGERLKQATGPDGSPRFVGKRPIFKIAGKSQKDTNQS
jgi:hypothetical protein